MSVTQTQRLLLQSNGATEDVVDFIACPTNLLRSRLSYTSFSSATNVLPTDQSHVTVNVIQSGFNDCQNVSVLLNFDALVGRTTFTLTATDPLAEASSCQASVQYTIAGLSIFDDTGAPATRQSTTPVSVYSGDENAILSPYRDVLQRPSRSLHVFVQFPDGTDSAVRPAEYLISALETIQVTSTSDASSPVQYEQSCSLLSSLPLSELPSNCGAAFQLSTDDNSLTYGLRYAPYKDGTTTLAFTWPSLTDDSEELFGEEYENSLVISVDGDPPPIIESVQPRRSFWRSGGERVTVTFDNVERSTSRKLRVGDFEFVEVPGTFRRLQSGLYSADFITAVGSGTDLDFVLEITMQDDTVVQSELVTEPAKFSYINVPLVVQSVDPPYSNPGKTITITGYFDGFDPSNTAHHILIGTKPLSSFGIVPVISEDRTSITFQLPERKEVGTAYEFPISIVINSEVSTSSDFSFVPDIPLEVSIRVLGASYDSSTDQYELGSCDPSSYIAELPEGISQRDVFEWNMVRVDGLSQQDVLDAYPTINATSKELRIPPTVFGGEVGSYEISVTCEVNEQQLNASVVIVKTEAPVIGVSLIPPSKRSITVPNVSVRVFAQIVTPPRECYDRPSPVSYEWTFKDQTYVKKDRNSDITREIREPLVGLLGREFVIPQTFLSYGNHSVSLRAYMKDDTGIAGIAITTVEIAPAGLVPVIGYGAFYFVQSAIKNLMVTSENSICPDCVALGRSIITAHLWTCKLATRIEDLDEGEPCTARFLPNPESESFSISSRALVRHGNLVSMSTQSGRSKRYYLQYTLQIGTESFLSEVSTQVIEISPSDNGAAMLDEIDILNNRGGLLEWESLPFYEDILIVPRSTNVAIAWDFMRISAGLNTNVLAEPKNLILHQGYYNPSLNHSQQDPLGIRAYALLPYERYTIRLRVVSTDQSVESTETTIVVRTKDKPTLLLPDLAVTEGGTGEFFSASATINLDSSSQFLFYFFAVDEDGREQCLDGCSGSSTIQFRIPIAGTFRILVRLRDIRATAVLDEAEFQQSLKIVESSGTTSAVADLSAAARLIRELERTGDHGSIQLLTSMLLSLEDLFASGTVTASDLRNYNDMINALVQVVTNSIPSTMSSKSFIVAAVRLSSMQAEFISTSSLNSLLSIVDMAVRRVPRTESFDHENELKAFYNLSIGHSLRLFSDSAPSRPSHSLNVTGADTRSIVFRVFQTLREHMTIVLSRNAQCGDIKTFSTLIRESEALAAILGSERELSNAVRQVTGSYDFLSTFGDPWKPHHSSYSLAVTCSKNQVNMVQGEATSFEWCEGSFSDKDGSIGTTFDPNRKQLFSLLETNDYLFFTGMVDHESDSVFLANTTISTENSTGVQDISIPEIPGCFHLNMSMLRLGATAYRGCLSAQGYTIKQVVTPPVNEQSSIPFERSFSEVDTNLPSDRSSTVVLSSSSTGTYGAVGVDCPVNARRPQVQTPEFNIEFGYLAVGGAMVGVVGVTVSWVTSSSSYAALVGTAAAA
ncbi:hypothetical protein BWQ96_03433 [Gracilariopsis chorda]|uniref:Uncharacterized protein n=1 Tax=Gracilariopsis chorda TaxID=448386 RepID=A0A2V3IX76_9FLOR|nr:hypothetical protein BWQ96_03433 [Gracilariopsis chorda]|eukprot:PXF46742.1 hypothetical protein BWQ96_03433 [Gracilariopsis chorda]